MGGWLHLGSYRSRFPGSQKGKDFYRWVCPMVVKTLAETYNNT